MEQVYYLLNNSNHLESVWAWVQSHGDPCYMYKTRLTAGTSGWVIEVPKDRRQTLFLIHWASAVEAISRPCFYDQYYRPYRL